MKWVFCPSLIVYYETPHAICYIFSYMKTLVSSSKPAGSNTCSYHHHAHGFLQMVVIEKKSTNKLKAKLGNICMHQFMSDFFSIWHHPQFSNFFFSSFLGNNTCPSFWSGWNLWQQCSAVDFLLKVFTVVFIICGCYGH